MAVLIDTNVVAAFLNPRDDLHDAARTRLDALRGTRLVISVVTVAEILAGVRYGHHKPEPAERFLGYCERISITEPIARRAAELRAAGPSGFKMPDALTLATAELRGVERAITGDDDWPKVPNVGVPVELIT